MTDTAAVPEPPTVPEVVESDPTLAATEAAPPPAEETAPAEPTAEPEPAPEPDVAPPAPQPAPDPNTPVVEEEPASPDVPVASGPLTIDPNVVQGNRLVSQAAATPDNPVKLLTDRIVSHFDALTPIVADLRALLDAAEDLLNKVRVGL